MKLPKYAISNYQFTIIVFLLLLVMGITSFLSMPRTEDPPIQVPGGSVIVIYPGTNPVDLEQLVADPIEEAINELEDIKKLNTSIKDGIVGISIEFNFNTDADEKFDELIQQVNNIKSDLPSDIYSIEINQWKTTDVNMLQMAFVSDTTPYDLIESKAGKLKTMIEKTPGIKKVELHANPQQEVRISLDVEKMAQMNISINDVSNAIKSNNANIPGGSLKISGRSFNVKTSGSYKNLAEIENTVVSSYKGRNIYLKNIGSVAFDYEDVKYLGRFEGIKAIFLTVQQKEDRNIFTIWDNLKVIIEDFQTTLDNDIKLDTVFNQTESVDNRINGFLSNLAQGIILVGIFIFLSLGYRESVMVIIAIPLSILMGLGFIDIAGFGLQQISIAALVIALGLLVDNSIVIVENIQRFIRNGYEKKEAAAKATSQIGWPVVTATITTLLAFIPIIMMPDKAGKFIKSLPVTVIFTLLSSLLIALTLTPFLSASFLSKNKSNKKTIKKRANLQAWLQKIIHGPYHKSLVFALKNKFITIFISILALGVALFIFFRFVGVSYFPKSEKPQFLIHINTPQSFNIHETDKAAKYVESVLDTIDYIKHHATNVGHGNPRIYYNIFPKNYDKNFAEIFVHLNYYDEEKLYELVKKLRKEFDTYSNAIIEVKILEQGPPISAPIDIKITGEDINVLKQIAGEVEQYVKDAKGTLNISNELDKTSVDIYVDINKDKASMLGVPVSEIDKTIRACINGIAVSKFRNKKGEEYAMIIRLPFENAMSYEDFDKIYVESLAGRLIPLKQLAKISFQKSPSLISHYNMERNASITAEVKEGYTLDEVLAGIEEKLKTYSWPPGYHYKFAGEIESRRETFGGMQNASLLALIAIFAVLVLQFRSLKQPLIIFTAIPLAIIGSIIALFITGYTFSFTAFIGLISLIGIVVNNSIILVDYTNKLIGEGKNIGTALVEAAETRFTPIILTTLTTVGGLLPLTLQGGPLWAPLGWTIIGGLIVSTALTLIVVPVLYKVFTVNLKVKKS